MSSIASTFGRFFRKLASSEAPKDAPHKSPDIESLCEQGVQLLQSGYPKQAKAKFAKVLALDSRHERALAYLGMIYLSAGAFPQALEVLDGSLAENPNQVLTLINRGNALHGLQRFEEAIVSYQQTLALDPNNADALNNLGTNQQSLGRYADALASYESAIALTPDHIEPHFNRGLVLVHLQKYHEAMASYDRVIELDPKHVLGHWHKATLLLRLGDFEQGLPYFEWRQRHPSFKSLAPKSKKPYWRGQEDIRGKTLLVCFEQGYGDFIQYCRYALLLESNNVKVLLLVPPALQRMARLLSPGIEVFVPGEALPPFDFQCPIMSLPFAFGTRIETIPSFPSYIAVNRKAQAAWQEKLGTRKGLRVGLVWSGRSTHVNDSRRSMQLAAIAPILAADAEIHCLQKEFREGDREALTEYPNVRIWDAAFDTFTDTGGLISLMDVVITVDTAVAHLAAAMGKTTWIMLDTEPDFRWLLEREDSPWYPSVRLFRQTEAGNWGDVVGRVLNALSEMRPSAEPEPAMLLDRTTAKILSARRWN